MATETLDDESKLRKYAKMSHSEKINKFLGEFGWTSKSKTEEGANAIIDLCIKRGFMFQKLSSQVTNEQEMRDLWLEMVGQYWYAVPNEKMMFGIVRTQFEFIHIGFLTEYSSTMAALIELSSNQPNEKRLEKYKEKIDVVFRLKGVNSGIQHVQGSEKFSKQNEFLQIFAYANDEVRKFLNQEFGGDYEPDNEKLFHVETILKKLEEDLEEKEAIQEQQKKNGQELTWVQYLKGGHALVMEYRAALTNFRKFQNDTTIMDTSSVSSVATVGTIDDPFESNLSPINEDETYAIPTGQARRSGSQFMKFGDNGKSNGIAKRLEDFKQRSKDFKKKNVKFPGNSGGIGSYNDQKNDKNDNEDHEKTSNNNQKTKIDGGLSSVNSSNNNNNNVNAASNSKNSNFGNLFGDENNNNDSNSNNNRKSNINGNVNGINNSKNWNFGKSISGVNNNNSQSKSNNNHNGKNDVLDGWGALSHHVIDDEDKEKKRQEEKESTEPDVDVTVKGGALGHSESENSNYDKQIEILRLKIQVLELQNKTLVNSSRLQDQKNKSVQQKRPEEQKKHETSQLRKIEVQNAYKLNISFAGLEDHECIRSLLKFCKRIQQWWMIYDDTLDQETAVRSVIANCLTGEALETITRYQRQRHVRFITIQGLLMHLLSIYGAQEAYKEERRQIHEWVIPQTMQEDRIVDTFMGMVQDYHDTLTLCCLPNDANLRLNHDQMYQILMGKFEMAYKREMANNGQTPTNLYELKRALKHMSKIKKFLLSSTMKNVDNNALIIAQGHPRDPRISYLVGDSRGHESAYQNRYQQSRYQQRRREFNPERGLKVDHRKDKYLKRPCRHCNNHYHKDNECDASDEIKGKFERYKANRDGRERYGKKNRPFGQRDNRGPGRGRRRYQYDGRERRDRKVNCINDASEPKEEEKTSKTVTFKSNLQEPSVGYHGGSIFNYISTPYGPFWSDEEANSSDDEEDRRLRELKLNVNAIVQPDKELSGNVSARELVKEVEKGFDLEAEARGDLWLIEAGFVDNKYGKCSVLMQADTGSQITVGNEALVMKYFGHRISTLKTPIPARLADDSIAKLNKKLRMTWYAKSGYTFQWSLYLLPGLNVPLLASLKQINHFGFMVTGRNPTMYVLQNPKDKTKSAEIEKLTQEMARMSISHDPEPDCDLSELEEMKHYIKVPAYQKTPYQRLVEAKSIKAMSNLPDEDKDPKVFDTIINKIDIGTHACEAVQLGDEIIDFKQQRHDEQLDLIEKELNELERVWNSEMKDDCKVKDIKFIERFEATKEEIEKAAKLCDDKLYDEVPTDHLIDQYGKDGVARIKNLINEFDDVFAKNRYDFGKAKNVEYHFGIKGENREKTVYTKQYHLSGEKRLAYLYDTTKKLEKGIYKKNETSRHNIPVILIEKSKTQDKSKGKRFRTAHDFSRLNKLMEDVVTTTPSREYIHSKLSREGGAYIVADIANCHESFPLAEEDQEFSHFETPLGGMVLTRATYGPKTIMATAQGHNQTLCSYLREKDEKGILRDTCSVFVDDVALKLPVDCPLEVLLWVL